MNINYQEKEVIRLHSAQILDLAEGDELHSLDLYGEFSPANPIEIWQNGLVGAIDIISIIRQNFTAADFFVRVTKEPIPGVRFSVGIPRLHHNLWLLTPTLEDPTQLDPIHGALMQFDGTRGHYFSEVTRTFMTYAIRRFTGILGAREIAQANPGIAIMHGKPYEPRQSRTARGL